MRTMDNNDDIICALYWCYEEAQRANKNQRVHSRYLKRFYNALSESDRRRRSGYYPRSVLHHPLCSAWRKLVSSEDDRSLIQATGLDFRTFRFLLHRFAPIYEKYSFYSEDGRIKEVRTNTGRPRSLNAEAALGLILMWTRTRGVNSSLSLIFGVTLPRVNLWRRFALRVLLSVLKREPSAKIKAPTAEDCESYVRAICDQYAIIGEKRVALALDGLKIPVCKPGCNVRQSAFYNGWTSGHYISNVFVFAPDGRIVAMVVNAPGAMHDSTLMDMGGLYDKMEQWASSFDIRMVVDSAFQYIDRPFLSRVRRIMSQPEILMSVSMPYFVRQHRFAKWQSGECVDSKHLFHVSKIAFGLRNVAKER